MVSHIARLYYVTSPVQLTDRYWKYEFLRRCLVPVAERFCADATPVKYCEVVEFDQKIRKFENEKNEREPRIEDDDPLNDALHVMMGQMVNAHCETRGFSFLLSIRCRSLQTQLKTTS